MSTVMQPQSEAQQTGPIATIKKQPAKRQQAASMPTKPRKKFELPGWLNSPWLLLAVPLLAGALWLVQNTWVVTENINKPYALLFGPALVGSFLALWLILKFFTAIEKACRVMARAFLEARKKDGNAVFYWIVIAVFMAVSVCASGDYFSRLEQDAIPGLGYASALFVDLVAVQCMKARVEAGRLRDKRGQWLYLIGVLVCALISGFANLFSSLGNNALVQMGELPPWMVHAAPYGGLAFPFLIVLLTLTADHTIDRTSSKLDPDEYEKQESKRVRLLAVQRDKLRERVAIEKDIDDLAVILRGGKERSVFFLIAWLFPQRWSHKRIFEQVEQLYKPQLEAMTEQNALLRKQAEGLHKQVEGLTTAAQSAYSELAHNLQGLKTLIDQQRDTDNTLIAEQLAGLRADFPVVPPMDYPAIAQELIQLLDPTLNHLQQEVESKIAGLQADLPLVPSFEAIAQEVILLLAPNLDSLRQEVDSKIAAIPEPFKPNYTELAETLAPVLITTVLTEVKTEVFEMLSEDLIEGESQELESEQTADVALLTSAKTAPRARTKPLSNEGLNGEQNEDFSALLQQPSVTLEEAARLLNRDVKYVRTLRARGKIKKTPRNDNLITTASIKSYLAESRPVAKV